MTDGNRRERGKQEGARRKDAALALLEARRQVWVRRGRRALLRHALAVGIATADDVADGLGETPTEFDPRWLGTVPGPLALAGIIRRCGFEPSCRPSRHASTLSVWELVNRGKALQWLAAFPDLPDPEPDDEGGTPCPATPPSPPSPSRIIVNQPTFF